MRFITFLLIFSIGIAFIYYREPIKRFTGTMSFAESWFGPGGTYTLYFLLGLMLSLGSILWVTGTLDALISSTVGRFFLTQ